MFKVGPKFTFAPYFCPLTFPLPCWWASGGLPGPCAARPPPPDFPAPAWPQGRWPPLLADQDRLWGCHDAADAVADRANLRSGRGARLEQGGQAVLHARPHLPTLETRPAPASYGFGCGRVTCGLHAARPCAAGEGTQLMQDMVTSQGLPGKPCNLQRPLSTLTRRLPWAVIVTMPASSVTLLVTSRGRLRWTVTSRRRSRWLSCHRLSHFDTFTKQTELQACVAVAYVY